MGRIFRFRKKIPRYGNEQEDHTMKIVGMPQSFWIVTMPTTTSELPDCCFRCDFTTYTLQIRGGLEIKQIVGIYAEEQDAKATATNLLAARDAKPPGAETVIHPSPFSDWYATQEDRRSVLICDNTSDEQIRSEPPSAWGTEWTWNFTQDGQGIVMRRYL